MADRLPRCAVVIPTFNGGHLTSASVDAVLADVPVRCRREVVVVDDGSSDGSDRELARRATGDAALTFVRLDVNGGFARACNAGAAAAGDPDYLLFLNNDTLPGRGWVDALVQEIEADEDVAAAGAKLLFANDLIQHAGVVIGQDRWPHHLYAGFPADHPAVNRRRDVPAVTAACMLIRRADFDALGGFDVAYLNGYEDVDLCLRLGERGRRIRYCPGSIVYHLESVTRWPEGVPHEVEGPSRVFAERWHHRIVPNDVQYYLDDGLLEVRYDATYPVTISASPELALMSREGEDLGAVDRLLDRRARQVMELLAAETRRQLGELRRPGEATAQATAAGPPRVVAAGAPHRLGEATDNSRLVSVVLPVKDGAPFLTELLEALTRQRASVRLEIIAVDSGSADDSVALLRAAGATVIAIDPGDFDHGLTRNLGAEHAHGDVLVFLSQRSLPVGDGWLSALLAALETDAEVVGACSRVVARDDADLLTRRDAERELSGSTEWRRAQITDWEDYERATEHTRRVFMNFHTVGTAIRRDAWERTPFRSVKALGEDLLWAREVLEAGWALVHAPASLIAHSHNYSAREVLSRNVDDGIANHDINDRALDETAVLPHVRAMVAADWEFLRGQVGDPAALEEWQFEAMLRRLAQTTGQWLGTNYEKLPEGTAARFSGIPRLRASADAASRP
jgi:GT2 family glycosyltransferase